MLHKLGLICFRASVGVAFLALQYALWLGDNGFTRWYELKSQLSQDRFAAKYISDKNTQLRHVVTSLKKGGPVTAHYAREKMYMIGDKEVLYRFSGDG